MKKYWRPGLQVWWRRDGEVQLGVDPPTILFNLTRAEHALLDALSHADPQLDCWTTARRLGWMSAPFRSFLDRLPAHALVDAPTLEASPTLRYWSLMGATGAPHSVNRSEATVALDGVDSIGLILADALCAAGITTLFLHDDREVLPRDVYPGGFDTGDIGHPRQARAAHRLRSRHPMASIRPFARHTDVAAPPIADDPEPAGAPGDLYSPALRGAHARGTPTQRLSPIDVAVIVAVGALPPHRAAPYLREEIPVLPLVVRELDIMIGPLLAPPGPCLRCLHLTFADLDPCWPTVATQLVAGTDPGIDPVVTQVAAAVATHQVVALADGRPASVVGTSLHVDGLHPIPRFQQWHPHPRCGCRLVHLVA